MADKMFSACYNISAKQLTFWVRKMISEITVPPSPLGLYLHFPWCPTRCIYCDFNTYVDGEASLKIRYHAALLREIREAGAALNRSTLDTIFIGGGTPTTLLPAQLIELVETVKTAFDLRPDAEVTVEANPGTLSIDYLREIRRGRNQSPLTGSAKFQRRRVAFSEPPARC